MGSSKKTPSEQSASSRLVQAGNIVGMIEIAERTGSTSHAVWNWTKRYDFPEPIARVSNKPVFDWEEVNTWNQNWERSKGGFHTHKAQREPAKKTTAAKRPAKKAAVAPPAKKAAAAKRTVTRTAAKSPAARARRSA